MKHVSKSVYLMLLNTGHALHTWTFCRDKFELLVWHRTICHANWKMWRKYSEARMLLIIFQDIISGLDVFNYVWAETSSLFDFGYLRVICFHINGGTIVVKILFVPNDASYLCYKSPTMCFFWTYINCHTLCIMLVKFGNLDYIILWLFNQLTKYV